MERCIVHRLGRIEYEPAWRLQDRLAAEIAVGERPPTLLLLEHPHTYTFGRSGHAENLLWDAAELERRGVQVHWVDRGGDVTYHGPGQLVGYPLLAFQPLRLGPEGGVGWARLPKADYVGYIRRLEGSLIRALAALGVAGMQVEGLTGVWVQTGEKPAKIAAIGVKVDARGVSRHGFALNIAPDMTYWQGIVGCGLKDYPIARLADLLDPAPSFLDVMDEVVRAFGQEFQFDMIEQPGL